MPSFTQLFILQTYNAANVLVEPLTRGYKFTGGAVVTTTVDRIVTVDLSGVGANAWDVLGNAGGGLVLGTNTPDNWTFISSGLQRGGFKFSGEFYLKTHSGYTNSEHNTFTNAITTNDATPSNIFVIPSSNEMNWYATVKIVARRDDGTERAAFERKFMFYREGAGVVLSTKVHVTFTDKTYSGYDILISAVGNNLIVQVQGETGHTVFWSGTIDYQGINTNL